MTKEITKAIILQEMQDKLKLRDFEPANFLFNETVIPIYDIGQHLLVPSATYQARTVTGTGGINFYTVPSTERWILHRYDVVFMGAGAYTVAGAYTIRMPDNISVFMDLTAAQTVSYHVTLPTPVILDPGDKIEINIDGYTSDLSLRLYIDYTKENLR